MPNIEHLPLCPYYQSEKPRTITCEDTYHTFDNHEQRKAWNEKYCDADWEQCDYAKKLSMAYDRYMKGDTMALKNQKINALEKELDSLSKKLGRSKKANERLLEQKKSLHEQLRDTKQELESANMNIFKQVMKLQQFYEDRLAYLIDKTGGSLKESDVEEWAKGKEYAITHDDKAEERTWTVIVREQEEENEQDQK